MRVQYTGSSDVRKIQGISFTGNEPREVTDEEWATLSSLAPEEFEQVTEEVAVEGAPDEASDPEPVRDEQLTLEDDSMPESASPKGKSKPKS